MLTRREVEALGRMWIERAAKMTRDSVADEWGDALEVTAGRNVWIEMQSTVGSNHLGYTPDQARAFARMVLAAADKVERDNA